MGRLTEVVKGLIIVNVIFYFGAQFLLPNHGDMFALWFVEHPNFRFWQPLTHMFMHDQNSITHLLFNMIALFFFGCPVEERLGRGRFLVFYLLTGLGAAFIHTLVSYFNYQSGYNNLLEVGFNPDQINKVLQDAYEGIQLDGQFSYPNVGDGSKIVSMIKAYSVSAVGASGAIYGVMAAFAVLFPNARIMLLFPPIPIKAKYFMPILVLIDLFSGLTGFSLLGQNIANFAHIGGAIFGIILILIWKKNSFNDKRWY